jgi:hypothetical protein
MNKTAIVLKSIESPLSGELSDIFIRYCEFCCKKCQNNSLNYNLCSKVSGEKHHYCEFCLRNGFCDSKRKNILMLSFKSIIAFFYYQNYLNNLYKRMWYHEIKDLISSHKSVGLLSPCFHYDENTLFWFIDFNKVGENKRQIMIDDVYETVKQIISSFNLMHNIPFIDKDKFQNKYITAIQEFYEKRERPNGKLILCPTFAECLPEGTRVPYDKIRNFSINQLECKKYS